MHCSRRPRFGTGSVLLLSLPWMLLTGSSLAMAAAPPGLITALSRASMAPSGSAGLAAQGADTAALSKVADAIQAWDGSNPGDLFRAIKQANPDKAAIVSMRELNKALSDKRMPAQVSDNAADITQKQKAAQRMVRERVLANRNATYNRYRGTNGSAFRSVYGHGDIGSWPGAADPDASMDIDWTVFGTDPNVTAELRDACKADLLRNLAGDDSGLTLADFDVVITAEGHERAAGVFETEGGIDWAKRNMKRVTIIQPDGTTRTYVLGASETIIEGGRTTQAGGDPIGEMAQAEHMAKFRDMASKNGDYERLFDGRGFLKAGLFDGADSAEAQALWNRYMTMLSDFGIDYYRSRSSTATGGCLDMAKHLQEEVITKKHAPKAKLKKTLKYVARADNISRGVPGLGPLLASDPLLSDPAYRDVVDLANRIGRVSDAEVDALIRERFGDMPDAGLQELGNKARRSILRMSEVAFQAEMDRIILEVPDEAARKAALNQLTDDFRVVADEGGEYGELARSAVEQISKIQDANDAGTIEQIRKNYQSLDRIRRADQGLISQTTEFLRQTELGRKMLDAGDKVLEIGKRPVFEPATGKYQSAAADFVTDLVDSTRAKGLTVVQVLGSAAMWSEVINSVRTAKSDAQLAIALGKTLINNTFFGMVLNSAYAGIVMGDNNALGKAVMYMLVPEAALPALVEALGNTAINMGAQTLFDAQMENVYLATTFKEGEIADFGGIGEGGAAGARVFVDTLCDGAPEMVAQDFVSKTKASDTAKGLNAVGIRGVAKSIRSTVDNGNVLVYTEDGALRKAAAAITRVTEDITDCGKAWGAEIALSAASAGDLPAGLDRAQTQALVKLMERRERARQDARSALTAAIVRTFEERHRAESALDGGTAKAEYEALLKIFEQLNIVKEGQASLDEEGAPYNRILKWFTSTREQQVTAVKAVQHFKDAYSAVLQARERAESSARQHLGEDYTPAPRPLTGALPLTGRPDADMRTAAAYLTEVGQIAAPLTFTMEAIKQGKLDGPYDEDMFRKICEVRFKLAYASAMMQGSREAQQLHWAVEVFDKQALFNEHSKWAGESSALQKEDGTLLDEFRAHYVVEGAFVVALAGPAQVTSGAEAALVASVGVQGKTGPLQPVSSDVAKQFRYVWTSGNAQLGDGPESSKSYRLDTVGTHTFTVRVTQTVMKAGKPVTTDIGGQSWPVKVVDATADEKDAEKAKEEKAKEDKAKEDKAKEDKAKEDKAAGEKPPAEAPPPGSGGVAGSGPTAASGSWVLEATSEATQPSKGMDQGSRTFSPGKIAFKGDSAASGDVLTFREGGETVNRQSSGTWTAFPPALVPGAPATVITVRSGFQPADLPPAIVWTTITANESGIVNVNAYGKESKTIALPASVPRWYLANRSGPPPQIVFEVLHHGPGGEARRKYTYTWRDGAAVPGATGTPTTTAVVPLVVAVSSNKPVPKLGETVTLSAAATGGVPPYAYAWTGASTGAAATLPFAVAKPGKNDFTVKVTDAKGSTASAPFSLDVKPVTVTVSASNSRIKLGQPLPVQAQVSSPGGTPPPAGLIYRWQPHPEVTFAPFEGAKNTSTGTFTKTGGTQLWVEVFQKTGAIETKLAESAQIAIDVLPPEISLRFFPAEPYPGQVVRVTASEDPTAGDAISYWWEFAGKALNPGAEANPRVYTYRPKDTTPVTVTAHGKAKDGGADLGAKDIVITAKPYDVKVSGPAARGPKPQIWSPQRRELVDVEQQIAVFQDVSVRVDVTPAPLNTPVRFQWAVTPDGCSVGNPISQDPTINCSQTGSYTATVTVTDNVGATLGSGSGPIAITISQADLTSSKQKADTAQAEQAAKEKALQEQAANREKAGQLRAEGQALQQQGKLREAIAKYRESLRYVPDPALETYITQVEAEAAKQDQAAQQKAQAEQAAAQKAQQEQAAAQQAAQADQVNREKARQLRADGQALQQQGKLSEAIARYRESLKYVPDPALEAYIAQVEAEAAKQNQAAQQKAQAEQAAAQQAAQADQVNREKARQLRADGQALQQQGRLREAIAKYRESLKYVPDPALETYIAQVEAQAATQEGAARQAKLDADRQAAAQSSQQQANLATAQRLLNEGIVFQKAKQYREAAAKYRESLTYRPNQELEQIIRQLDAAVAQQDEAARQAKLDADRRAASEAAAKQRAEEAKRESATPRPAPPPPPATQTVPPAKAPTTAAPTSTRTPPPTTDPVRKPVPQTAPAGCSLTGDWSFSQEGAAFSLSLRQSGTNVEGTLKVTDPSMGINETLPAKGTMSMPNVRIAAVRPDEQLPFSGTVSSDCRTMNLSVTMDGETQVLAFRRR